jgi:hypothetical protein
MKMDQWVMKLVSWNLNYLKPSKEFKICKIDKINIIEDLVKISVKIKSMGWKTSKIVVLL